ncbi:MAG TPA: DUF433 domain-containing protein [Thermoanaerobaculia bacterium]
MLTLVAREDEVRKGVPIPFEVVHGAHPNPDSAARRIYAREAIGVASPVDTVNCRAMTRDANALLQDALQLPEHERHELAARLLAQESSVISAQPGVMSGAPVFRGTRVLVQTLIEHLEAGDSIDDFLEGFPSVTREQVIAFLAETKARVLAYGNEDSR